MKILDVMNTIPKKLKVVNGVLVFTQSYKSELCCVGATEEVEEFSNEPISGIKIVKHFINGFCPVLFAEDPRGFSVRLSVENVIFSEELLTTLQIDNGVIKDKCIYYYDSGIIYIISVLSDTYRELSIFTDKRDKEKALLSSNLEVGATYRHKSLGELIYLGKYSLFERAFSWLEQDEAVNNVRVNLHLPYRLRSYSIINELRKRGVDVTGLDENSPEYIAEYNRVYKEIGCVPFKVSCGEYHIFASVTENFTFGEAKHYWDNKVSLIFRRRIDKNMFVSKIGDKHELATLIQSYLFDLDILSSETNYTEPEKVASLFYEDTASVYRRQDAVKAYIHKLGKDGKEAIRTASKLGVEI